MFKNKVSRVNDVLDYLEFLTNQPLYYDLESEEYKISIKSILDCLNVLNYLLVKNGESDRNLRNIYSLIDCKLPKNVDIGLKKLQKQINVWKGVF